MDKYNQAILWPVNSKPLRSDMLPEEADVEKHCELARIGRAVYWDIKPKRKELEGPFDGYLYIALPVGRVVYRCVVDHVISRDRLLNMQNEHEYVPPFRKQCLFGFFEDGRKHEISHTWIKMREIRRLDEPIGLDRFRKRDGTPVRSTHSGLIYIQAPNI